jgi:hypothetical protein
MAKWDPLSQIDLLIAHKVGDSLRPHDRSKINRENNAIRPASLCCQDRHLPHYLPAPSPHQVKVSAGTASGACGCRCPRARGRSCRGRCCSASTAQSWTTSPRYLSLFALVKTCSPFSTNSRRCRSHTPRTVDVKYAADQR